MGILKNIGKKSSKADKKAENKDEKHVPGSERGKKVSVKTEAKASDSKTDEKKPAKKVTKTVVRQDSSDAYRIIVAPVVTEKAERLQTIGKYTFQVAKDANKVEIARAIRDIYGVTPADVNVQVNQGKEVRFGRYSGKRKDTKKAVVTLAEGETLSIMEV